MERGGQDANPRTRRHQPGRHPLTEGPAWLNAVQLLIDDETSDSRESDCATRPPPRCARAHDQKQSESRNASVHRAKQRRHCKPAHYVGHSELAIW
eukprot:2211034-Pleurochrysis_carterae.AAC.5